MCKSGKHATGFGAFWGRLQGDSRATAAEHVSPPCRGASCLIAQLSKLCVNIFAVASPHVTEGIRAWKALLTTCKRQFAKMLTQSLESCADVTRGASANEVAQHGRGR